MPFPPTRPLTASITELARSLRLSHKQTMALVAKAGIALKARTICYDDERPRKTGRRFWRRLTREEIRAVVELRARSRRR